MIKKRLIGLLSAEKKYIGRIVLLQWIALLSQIGAVIVFVGFFEAVLQKRQVQMRPAALLFFVLCIGIRFFCIRMSTRISARAGACAKNRLRQMLYEKLLLLGAAYKDQISTSEVVQVSTEGIEQLEIYFGKYLPQLFYSLLAPLTLFVFFLRISPVAGVVLLLCVPLIPFSIALIQTVAKKLLGKYWCIYMELGDSFLENLQGLTTLKIYQADEKKAREMEEEAQKFRRITMKVLRMQLNSTSVMDIMAYGSAAAGMAVALMQLHQGVIGAGEALTVILLASEFFLPLRLLGSFFHIAMNGMSASDRLFRILDLPAACCGTNRLEEKDLTISLSGLCFSYDDTREILHEINMELPPGSFTALAGRSGCGKSTLAALIAGKTNRYEGILRIGELSAEEIDPFFRMKRIVLVRHDSYLFQGSIAENLKMAKENASEQEMQTVLKRVNLLEFAQSRQGLETRLSERGANLSGGQRQRLALARALLADAPVYIFDEATSNIDAESEAMIMDIIHELSETKTILLISHRLANVKKADRIYFLKEGRITECGMHAELLAHQGEYMHMYEEQAGYERLGGMQAEH